MSTPSGTPSDFSLADGGEPQFRDVTARGLRVRFTEAGSLLAPPPVATDFANEDEGYEEGPASAPAQNVPVVCVHGFLSSRRVWDRVLPRLAATRRVICPDLPGFGESEKPDPARYSYAVDSLAESLLDVASAVGASRFDLIGHGLGGGVALALAVRHPSVVQRLVLVAPHVFPADPPFLLRAARWPVLGRLLFKQVYGRTAIERLVLEETDSEARERAGERLFAYFNAPEAREAAYATLEAMSDTRTLVATLPRVLAESLVVWGRDDRRYPVTQARRLCRELGGARLEVLECGPTPQEDLPEPFADAVIDFLDGPSRAPRRAPSRRQPAPVTSYSNTRNLPPVSPRETTFPQRRGTTPPPGPTASPSRRPPPVADGRGRFPSAAERRTIDARAPREVAPTDTTSSALRFPEVAARASEEEERRRRTKR
jgi:pimeloyl-ACP methyl ester carboxylesterase